MRSTPRSTASLQLELYSEVQSLLLERVVWFKRNVSFEKGLSAVVERFGSGIAALRGRLESCCRRNRPPCSTSAPPISSKRAFRRRWPNALPGCWPKRHSGYRHRFGGNRRGSRNGRDRLLRRWRINFQIGSMHERANDLDVRDYYDGLALDRARATLFGAHRALAVEAVKGRRFRCLAGEARNPGAAHQARGLRKSSTAA